MVVFLPVPLGNLSDINYRAIEVLQQTQIVFCEDTRITKRLLFLLEKRFNISFPKYHFISFHSHNENEVLKKIDPDIFQNNCVYMSDAGMPGISDPGVSLVRFCQEHNIKYDVIPGANAALTSFVMSGFGERFIFYGFLPHKKLKRKEAFKEILSFRYPVVVYEYPHRIETFFQELSSLSPQSEIFAVKEISKKNQKFFKSLAKEALTHLKKLTTKGEWSIVIKPFKDSLELDLDMIELFKKSNFPKKEASKILSLLYHMPSKEIYSKLI